MYPDDVLVVIDELQLQKLIPRAWLAWKFASDDLLKNRDKYIKIAISNNPRIKKAYQVVQKEFKEKTGISIDLEVYSAPLEHDDDADYAFGVSIEDSRIPNYYWATEVKLSKKLRELQGSLIVKTCV